MGREPRAWSSHSWLDNEGDAARDGQVLDGGASPSLSFCNNSNKLGSKAPSYVAKKAESLRLNLKAMIEKYGLDQIGFFTLTFADNVVDRKEAQRRFNSFAVGFIRDHVNGYIAAVERQLRGAVHYHLVVALPFDIRSGFDFGAARKAAECHRAGDREGQRRWERLYFASANEQLRGWWRLVRQEAPKYGFGRCETLPVLSNEDGICYYVGGYVASEWQRRDGRDKGLRTLRYGLDKGVRRASQAFSWAKGAGKDWRDGCAVVAGFLMVRDLSVVGKRWAFELRREVGVACVHWAELLAVPMSCRGETVAERVAFLRAACARITSDNRVCGGG